MSCLLQGSQAFNTLAGAVLSGELNEILCIAITSEVCKLLARLTEESNCGKAVNAFLHALVMIFTFAPVLTVTLLLLPRHRSILRMICRPLVTRFLPHGLQVLTVRTTLGEELHHTTATPSVRLGLVGHLHLAGCHRSMMNWQHFGRCTGCSEDMITQPVRDGVSSFPQGSHGRASTYKGHSICDHG
eukprot:Skav205750  [mRNA]  locus=scaffold2771:57800:61385:+ [translate_table: standard]